MNKILIAINALLIVAVGVLFYFHFSTGGDEATMVADSTVVNAKGKAVVYINTDSLMANYGYSKKIQDELNVMRTTAENTLKAKQGAFQRKVDEYKLKAEYMTAPERGKTESDLQNMQADLENASLEMQGKLQNDAATRNEKLFEKVELFLKEYAKANGHIYVLQYTRGISPILFGDPSLDVTKDVVNKLNDRYKKEEEEGTTEAGDDKKDDKKKDK